MSSMSPAPAEPAELLALARENIDAHRKTDLNLGVCDPQHRPIPGATVEVSMERHEFLFGCAFFEALADSNPVRRKNIDPELMSRWDELRAAAVELFNFNTLPFYWGGYEPEDGQPRLAQMQALYDWSKQQDWTVKAHPLVWCQANPDWIPSGPAELKKRIRRRIDELVEHFGPLSDRPLDWVDFINEPTIQPWNMSNPMALWQRTLGPAETVKAAWDFCQAFGLPQRGVANHFMWDEEFFEATEMCQASGRAFRAIGLQSHQHAGIKPLAGQWDASSRFADALGTKIHWTENSIPSAEFRKLVFVDGVGETPEWPSTPEGEAMQARALADQYTVLFGHPAVEAITQWDLTDAYSWLNAPVGLLDSQLRRKPAYDALHDLIRKQWWTETTLTTDANGEAPIRAFKGTYHLRVINDGKTLLETTGRFNQSAHRFWLIVQPSD